MVLSCQISIAVEGNSCWRMPALLIGPRLLACAREDGDVEVQWEEGIGGSRYVTKCWEFKLILKQFIWWSCTSPLYPWITVWTFQLLQNRDTVTNFIVTLRSTHALVFNLFEETENSVATSNSVTLKPFLVCNVLFPAYAHDSLCCIVAYP